MQAKGLRGTPVLNTPKRFRRGSRSRCWCGCRHCGCRGRASSSPISKQDWKKGRRGVTAPAARCFRRYLPPYGSIFPPINTKKKQIERDVLAKTSKMFRWSDPRLPPKQRNHDVASWGGSTTPENLAHSANMFVCSPSNTGA